MSSVSMPVARRPGLVGIAIWFYPLLATGWLLSQWGRLSVLRLRDRGRGRPAIASVSLAAPQPRYGTAHNLGARSGTAAAAM